MFRIKDIGELGFPAFNEQKVLQGFYQACETPNGATVAEFQPLTTIPNLTENSKSFAVQQLQDELDDNSDAVFTLAKCNNCLQTMKDNAIIYSWKTADADGPLTSALADASPDMV